MTDSPERGRRPEDRHVPVLFEETMRFLNLYPGNAAMDATLGLGGHAAGIAERIGAGGRLYGFDRDPAAFALATARLQALPQPPELLLSNEAYSQAARAVPQRSLDALVADFGVSSMQFDERERGFSFQADAPLDMRMDTRRGATAEQVVNQLGERELADLIYEFGEERRSRRIARAIVRARPLSTTVQLAGVISAAAPPMKSDRIHPATRTFQALRIFVNQELEEIKALLQMAPGLLRAGGRLVCISFHSLEDRLVKDALRDGARDGIWEILTRKPVTAGERELEKNARARSAKLRAATRL